VDDPAPAHGVAFAAFGVVRAKTALVVDATSTERNLGEIPRVFSVVTLKRQPLVRS